MSRPSVDLRAMNVYCNVSGLQQVATDVLYDLPRDKCMKPHNSDLGLTRTRSVASAVVVLVDLPTLRPTDSFF